MEERVVKWLGIDEMRILKQIIIVSDRKNGEAELGSIVYTRPITANYDFKKQQEENDGEALSNLSDKFFQEYPKQKNYPNDLLDKVILESVRSSYPKSILKNDTILFNVDLEKIKTLKNRIAISSSIYFSPEFSNIGSFHEYVGKEFRAPRININVYCYYRPEFLDGHIFYATYNVSQEYALENLKTLKFE